MNPKTEKILLITGIIFLILVLGSTAGYFFWSKMNQSQQNNNQIVGGDKDEHGCMGSAGYTWCEVKNKCLRTWEEPCDMVDIPSTDGWTVYIDNEQGFKFKYPENLKTDNLSLNQWPPRIDIKKLDSENFCKTDDEKIEIADGIICGNLLNDYDKHDNRYYNVNYAYKFTKNNIDGEISFTIDYVCYSSNCIEDLKKSFDTNKLITEIFNTIEFFDTNEENNNGTIEGSLSYPSDYIPEKMRMCAVNIDTKEEYWTSRHIENDKYRYGSGYKINVPAGNYYVFANISRNMRKDYYRGDSHEKGSSTNPYMLTVEPKKTIFIGTIY